MILDCKKPITIKITTSVNQITFTDDPVNPLDVMKKNVRYVNDGRGRRYLLV